MRQAEKVSKYLSQVSGQQCFQDLLAKGFVLVRSHIWYLSMSLASKAQDSPFRKVVDRTASVM